MRKIATLFLMSTVGLLPADEVKAQDVGLKWVRDFGSAKDSEFGLKIHTDKAGYIYTTGFVGDMVDFNRQGNVPVIAGYPSNSGDAFVTKHNTDGDLIWVRTMVGPSSERGNGVTTDKDGNVYVVGNFFGTTTFNPGGGAQVHSIATKGSSDMFITKYDKNGVFQWVKTFGGTGTDDLYDVQVDSSGNVYAVGLFDGTVDFGNIQLTASGALYAVVMKLNPAGDVQWAHAFGVGGPRGTQHSANAVTVDEDQNIYVLGDFTETVDFDPSAGTSNLTSAGNSDIYLLKLTNAGNFVWVRSFPGPNSSSAIDLHADGMGNIYAAGWFTDSMAMTPNAANRNTLLSKGAGASWNGFVARFDKNGNYSWGIPVGDKQSTQVLGVSTDVSGNVYITGYYDGIVDFDPHPTNTALRETVKSWDIFVARYSPAGEFVWVKTAGGTGDPGAPSASDVGHSIAVDTGYNVYVTGYYQGTVDFDPGPDTAAFTTAGRTDVYIWKLRCPETNSVTVVDETCSSSYTWNGIEYHESGIYYQSYYLGEGCDSVASLELTLGEAVRKPLIDVREFTLSVPSGYASYQWLFNGAKIDGATDSTLVVDKNGNYAVVVSNSYNCVDTSDEYQVNNVSVKTINSEHIRLAPNPASSVLYIYGVQPELVTIATLEGRQVASYKGANVIDISNLSGGIYIVAIYGEEGILKREKFIKLD